MGTQSGVRLPLDAETHAAAAIVIGRVLAQQGLREDPDDPDGFTAYTVTLQVLERLKGKGPETFAIRNENTSSRYPMAVGEEHLLFITHAGGGAMGG